MTDLIYTYVYIYICFRHAAQANDIIYTYIWLFPKIMVPPNHPILIGFSMK